MAEEAGAFYVANYIQCFSMEDVAAALAQIPQVRLVVGVWLRGWAACISCSRGGLAPQQQCARTATLHRWLTGGLPSHTGARHRAGDDVGRPRHL